MRLNYYYSYNKYKILNYIEPREKFSNLSI